MRAIIVRHYKTVSNASNRIIGWGESPPVLGWQRDMKHVDRKLHNAHIHFDTVYTSSLQRARNTGQFYAQGRGISEIHESAALNEINYGDLSKKSKKWVQKHVPQHKKDPDFVYPGGESFRQMQQRSAAFIQSLALSKPHSTVLIVVHAGVIRGLVCHFVGLEYASNLKRRITHRYIGDFTFSDSNCVRYNELGTVSGFVKAGIVALPWYCEELQSA